MNVPVGVQASDSPAAKPPVAISPQGLRAMVKAAVRHQQAEPAFAQADYAFTREAARRAIATLDRGSGVDQSELMLKTEQLTAAKTK